MTTQSKSVLVPFLIIAGLIFAVAVAWKFLGGNDENIVVKSPEVEVITPVKPKTTHTSTVVDYDQSNDEPFIDYTEEDRKASREQAKSSMKFSMRYSTFDKAITGLDNFRKNGNHQSAEDLINYIYRAFPNETIPADLLDR